MKIKKQSGLTLIEVIFSVSIGFILLNLLVVTYLLAQKNHQSQIALNALTQNEMKAIDIFKNQLEKANKISGNNKEISIEYADFKGAILLKNMTDFHSLLVSPKPTFKIGDVMVISDGIHVVQFKVATVSVRDHEQYLQSIKPLPYLFKAPSEIGKWVVNHYYLNKKTSTLNIQIDSDDHQKLVDGIIGLGFLYYVNENPIETLSEGLMPRAVEVVITASFPPYTKTWTAFLPIKNNEH